MKTATVFLALMLGIVPSKHFQNLVSTAVEYVSLGLGASYNFRESDVLKKTADNVEAGTGYGKGLGLAGSLYSLAESYTQTL